MRIADYIKRDMQSEATSEIVHIMISQKFTASFIEFANDNFPASNCKFNIIGPEQWEYGLSKSHNVKFRSTHNDLVDLLATMDKCKRIILHGLWKDEINLLLANNPHLLKKTYWIVWGGDLYDKYWIRDQVPDKERIRRIVIKNLGFIVSNSESDVSNVRCWYETEAQHIKSFCYTSNIVKQVALTPWSCGRILIGNSSTYTNNHLEIFNKLLYHRPPPTYQLFTPLSYGDDNYKDVIKAIGQFIFSDRFIPLTEFIDPNDYLSLLSSINVAIFAYDRQQAFSNIINLLGMGSNVFLKTTNPLWSDLSNEGFEIHDFSTFSHKAYSLTRRNINNIKLAQQLYSKQALVNSIQPLFA